MLPLWVLLLLAQAPGEVGTSSSTRDAVSSTVTAGSGYAVSRSIELDPNNRSTCDVGKKGVRARLNLEGMKWKDWDTFCKDLESYLHFDRGALADNAGPLSEKRLGETGYFDAVVCTASVAAGEISCSMSPKSMVRDVDIKGDLPFVLLEEDVRRQVFLRPGVPIESIEEVTTKQEHRIETYLERQGFFGNEVHIETQPGRSGAQPNAPLNIDAHIDTGVAVTVRKVNITGHTGLEREDIEETIRHYWIFKIIPRRFTPDVFEEDIDGLTRKLQKKGWPEARITTEYEVDTQNGKVDVDVEVETGPKLALRFEGNPSIDSDDLEELGTFVDAGTTDPVEVDNTAKSIREKYQNEGFYLAKVTYVTKDEGEPGQEIRTVTYKIEEGPRAEIEEIQFTGNAGYSEDDLARDADLKTTANKLLSSGRWVDSHVKRDLSAIRSAYKLKGYAAADAVAHRKILPNRNIEVVFEIEEGAQRTVGEWSIHGLPKEIELRRLKRELRLIEGKPFVEEQLASDRRELLTVLAAYGYTRATVALKMKVPFKTEAGKATMEYKIEPGPRSTFGGFLVRGAFRTRTSVIEDELKLDTGEALDLLALTDVKQRLRTLGVFSSVDLKPLAGEEGDNETWLLVDVTEREQLSLDLVFAFSSDQLFRVGADFRDNNFLGRAIRLNIGARLSNASDFFISQSIGRSDSLIAELHAPHPLGLPFNADYSAFYTFEDQTRRESTIESPVTGGFTRRRAGVGAAVSRMLIHRGTCAFCPEVVGRLGYELATVEGINFSGEEIIELVDTPNLTIARIVPSVSVQRTDSPVDPRSGYAGNVRFEIANAALAGPFNNGQDFWRLLSSNEVYWKMGTPFREELSESVTLGGHVVLATGIRYGVGQSYGRSSDLPVTETFDYGGDMSVRGLREKASIQAVPLAHYLFLTSMELRYYVLDTAFGAFQIAAISDFGAVSRRMGELFSDPTVSAGAAIRYITPVGPVSLAYAVPFIKAEGITGNGRIHFAFGYSF